MLYLVRHAKAGSRHDFKGNDRLRPLSPPGRRQAEAIATRLTPPLTSAGVTVLLSSPYLRCMQTLRPLAKAIGATVEPDERLAEGRSYIDVLELLGLLPDETALCSHGDVIPDTIAALERRGCEFISPPDWRKGSVWVLERDSSGEIASAESWPPPDIGR
ncbi:MAG: phosphoglycerate mutase family protein [Ilumatobacteraceae bacterium]